MKKCGPANAFLILFGIALIVSVVPVEAEFSLSSICTELLNSELYNESDDNEVILSEIDKINEGTSIDNESIRATMLKLPLSFIENRGQSPEEVEFVVKTSGQTVFFTPSEVVFSLSGGDNSSVVRLAFEGSEPVAIAGEDPLSGKANFFIGNDSAGWETDIPTYGAIRYKDLYPGVDLVFKGREGYLKHELVVSPGADPAQIVMTYSGQDNLSLMEDGSVQLRTAAGNLTDSAPVCYQEIDGRRDMVEGGYRLVGENKIGFEVGDYDQSHSLVIDPALVYSTYLGGSSRDSGIGIAVDGSGNAYITGETDSTNFPTKNPIQASYAGDYDAFIAKIDVDGSALVYSTYFGGSSYDFGYDIAVDGSGNAYITGETYSANFPTKNPIQASYAGVRDAFVAKIDVDGSALVYSTYFGGSSYDFGYDIAVDGSGNAYITGETDSTNFPTKNPIQESMAGLRDAFVAKIDADGAALVYSTYLGGNSHDYGSGIAVDGSGNAYITGYTFSDDFPTKNPIQESKAGDYDAFVAKIDADGSALVYSTYLGGSGSDHGSSIALDGSGNAYIIGQTDSTNFPTKNPIQESMAGLRNAFVAKIDADGSALVYSTYLGGISYDYGNGIAVDGSGNAYIIGYTTSDNFPIKDPIQESKVGDWDAFVAKIDADGSALVYSTYLGGSSRDFGNGIAVDGSGNAYITGETSSANFPTKDPIQASNAGIRDAFAAVIDSSDPISNSPPNTPSVPLGSDTGLAGTAYSYSTSATDPDGDQVKYTFDWGDGSTDTTGLVDSCATASASHSWNDVGTYEVKVKATDSKGASSGWSDTLTISITNPVILIYGIFGKADDLNPIEQRLKNAGFTVFKFDWAPAGPSTATGNISNYAIELIGFISQKKKETGAKKVDIVAHSMGGLIARTYIETLNYGENVDRLIMIGTPNYGSYLCDPPGIYMDDFLGNNLAIGWRWPLYYGIYGYRIFQSGKWPVLESSTLPAMEQMKHNSKFLDILGYNGKPYYHLIIGTEPHDEDLMVSWEFIREEQTGKGLLATPNDGAVAAEDVLLNNVGSKNYYRIDHFEELTLMRDGQPFDDEIDKIKSILIGSPDQSLNNRSSGGSNAINATPVESLPAIDGTIYPNDKKNHNINMSLARRAKIFLLGQGGNLTLNLTTPTGKAINKSIAQIYDNITYYEGSPANKGYAIDYPESGTWNADVRAINVSSDGENYIILTFIETNLTLSAKPTRYHFHQNESIEVISKISNNSLPVTDANVIAYFVKPDNLIENILLFDNGLRNDTLANDGIYANSFLNSSLNGTYQITVVANGTLNNSDFMRLGSATVWVKSYPDLAISTSDINISNSSPLPGENVTLSATIHNIGNDSATNASILFYDGSHQEGKLISEHLVNISAGKTAKVMSFWNAELGHHQIYVWIRLTSNFLEMNYSNNEACRDLYLGNLHYPDFTDTVNPDSWRSWLVLQNPNEAATNVTLSIRSRSGDMLYEGDTMISPYGVSAIRPRNLVGADCAGSVIVSSDQPLTGTCQITRNSNEMCMGYNALDGGSTVLYYPDFTDTANPDGWRSWLVLQNPAASPANLDIEIRSRAGDVLFSGEQIIPAHGVNAIRPRNLAGSDCAGSVFIESDLPVIGTCQITRNSNKMCMSYTASDHGSTTLYYPDFTDTANPDGWRSWLVLQNPSDAPANLNYEIRSRAGDLLYAGSDIIPAHGVNAVRPRNLAGADCAGSVVVTSDQPIVGTCQITRNSNEMCMSYNALDQSSTVLNYPDFTDTANPDGWRSWLVLQNPTAADASITLKIRSREGDLLYGGDQIIPAQGVNAIRPRSLVGSDCSGSVTVTSDQPIVGTCQITRNNNLMCMSYAASGATSV